MGACLEPRSPGEEPLRERGRWSGRHPRPRLWPGWRERDGREHEFEWRGAWRRCASTRDREGGRLEPGRGVCSEALKRTRKPRREYGAGRQGGGGRDPGWENGGGGLDEELARNWSALTSAPSEQELSVSGAKHKGV